MNNSFLDKQKEKAYDNYNYFVMKMITNILKICFSLAIILLISNIFDYSIIDIIALIYTFISIYSMYKVIDNYSYILNDIKNTLELKDICYVINFDELSNYLFKGLVNYGK